VTWILRISTLLNLGLLVVAGIALRRPAEDRPASTSKPPLVTPSVVSVLAPATTTPVIVYTTNEFRWDVLENTNYDEFVSNLRAVNCPELTIRDLIFADAERRYAQLESEPDETIPFWLAGRARADANRRNEENRSTAQTALVTEVSQLFGVEWSPEESETHEVQVQALARIVIGPVSDQEYELVWRWFVRSATQQQSYRRNHQYLLLSDDLSSLASSAQSRRERLEAALGPATFTELQARTSFLEEAFDSKSLHVRDLELTGDELRRLSLLKAREVGWLDELFQVDRNHSDEDREARQLAFIAAAKDTMSPDHYDEFVRVQDEPYRNLIGITRDHDLPRSVARQVYEIRQLAIAEYQQLRAQPNGPDAVAAAAQLQFATAQSVQKLLGESAFKTYTARSGKWVNDLGTP